MSEWQDIATAPIGQVLVLGWWFRMDDRRAWECEIEYYDGLGGQQHVTHWMPLPPPPTSKEPSHV